MKSKTMLAMAAFLAITVASCSKNEVSTITDSPISFHPNALETKALILPSGNSPEQAAFPTNESFNVFAFADLDGAGTSYSMDYASPLMNDVNISNVGGDWKATSGKYLWPAAGTCDFYAYYPASVAASFDTDVPAGISLSGVDLGSIVGNQSDPMVAATLSQVSSSKPMVNLVFKHISSQIAVTVFDATTNTELTGYIRLKEVHFKNMKTTGDYREGAMVGKGTWSNIAGSTDILLFQGNESVDTAEKYLAVNTFADVIGNESAFVVVPEPVVAAGSVQSLEVTYSIDAFSLNGFNYPASPEKTVSVPLYGRISGNTLMPGKRYVFHIGISLDGADNEISFTPLVDGWETEDITGILIDAVTAAEI